MDPRLRWAGGAAAVAIFAIVAGMAAPASAQTSSSPPSTSSTTTTATTRAAPQRAATTSMPASVEGTCWMGANRPIFRVHNTDPRRTLDYTVRSGTATRSGALTPGSGEASTAYVVGAGTFPKANPTTLTWTTPDDSGTVSAGATAAQYCTYDITPEVRWRTAAGDSLATPTTAAGLVVTLSGPLEQLFCGWSGGNLDCTQQALATSPLAPGSYPARRDRLEIPAFATRGASPAYAAKVTAPAGFVLVGGSGTFPLDDAGAGLGQGNVDRRMASLLGGAHSHRHVVTLQQVTPAPPPTTSAPTPASEVTTVPTIVPASGGVGGGQQVPPPTTVAPTVAPDPAAPVTTPAPAGAPVVTTDANMPLPRTGTVAPGIVGGGAAIVTLGLALVLLGRRRTSHHAAG